MTTQPSSQHEAPPPLFRRLLLGGLKLGGGFLLWFFICLATVMGLQMFLEEYGGDRLTGDALPPEFLLLVANGSRDGAVPPLVLLSRDELNEFIQQNPSRHRSFLLPNSEGEVYQQSPKWANVRYKAVNLSEGRQRIALKVFGAVDDITIIRYEAEEKRVHPKYYFRGNDFQMYMLSSVFGFPLSFVITYLLLRGGPAVYRVMRSRN